MMFANISLLHLILALVISIGIFIFLLFLLLPGKEEKSKRSEKLEKVSYPGRAGYPALSGRGEESPLLSEMDRNAIFATLTVIGEKIDELNKKIDGYNEEIKKMEMMISHPGAIGRSEDKEMFNKLSEKINSLEEKIGELAVEKTEISEIKDKLNEVVTILKTLGS